MMNSSCAVIIDPLTRTVPTTFVDELDLKLRGSDTHVVPFLDGSFIEVDELADKGEHHQTEVFYPHEFDLIDLNLNYTTTNRNGKETTKKGVVKERIGEEDYRIELSNGNHRVLSYQELIPMLNKDDEDDVERWTFEEIKGHRWSKDKNRKGKVDVLILWKGYEEDSWEPMEVIKKDDPATLVKYAYDNDLTDKTVWKWANRYSKNIKKLKRMVRNLRASKRSSRGIKYKFEVRVPRNIAEAYKLDQENGNSLWTEAIDREVKLLRDDFECFRVGEESEITGENQKIPLLWTCLRDFYELDRLQESPTNIMSQIRTSKRHHGVDANLLSLKWGIGLEKARNTIKHTTQMNIRSALLPLTRRYRTDLLSQRLKRLSIRLYTDNIFSKVGTSLRGNTCAQIFTDGNRAVFAYPMRSKAQAGDKLLSFIQQVGIPNENSQRRSA